MPIVKTKARSSTFMFCLLLFIAFISFVILSWKNDKLKNVLDFTDFSIFFALYSALTVIILTSIFHLVIVLATENWFGNEKIDLPIELWKHIENHKPLLFGILLFIFGSCCILPFLELRHILDFLHLICASLLFASIHALCDYDDVDLASSQNIEKSIGTLWAFGAYSAFYKIVLKDIVNRMRKFENEHKITLLVKELVIIYPLSCNANGSLNGRDGKITYVGKLDEITDDQGANLNRSLSSTVYCIENDHENIYIAAEIPSPLATLDEMKLVMNDIILKYHRDCFMHTLSSLIKGSSCIILEYDDLNPLDSEPLHSFLISRLSSRRQSYQEKPKEMD
ncbi:uncharacterized protein CDAR_102552 [Caerostris darwini]|uniref:STING ligand-binding domain-containing protein n=1 Tax=Caerostris darwini TaxID=1538125 RepID=A0AAV4WZL5_9ARAC|nr:uncharacterized protein CDAR_102552 [Caerostris darwini]